MHVTADLALSASTVSKRGARSTGRRSPRARGGALPEEQLEIREVAKKVGIDNLEVEKIYKEPASGGRPREPPPDACSVPMRTRAWKELSP